MHLIQMVRDPHGCHEALYVDGKLEYDDESIRGDQWESVIQRYKTFSRVESKYLTSAYMDDKGYYFPNSFNDYAEEDFE